MCDVIFCLPQIKARPIIGVADKAFMEKWSSIKTKAEKDFLALQQEFVSNIHPHFTDLSETLATQLEKDMGPEKYHEAEEAILTVATCIRAKEYTKLNGRWVYNLANHEASKYVSSHPEKRKTKAILQTQPPNQDHLQRETIGFSKRPKGDSQGTLRMNNTTNPSVKSKPVGAKSMQQSSHRPLLVSSTKPTRSNNNITTLSNDNFSNNINDNSNQHNHNNQSIENNQNNGNFTIDIEHIMNNELLPNSQSLTDTIHNQNVNKDTISIRIFDKIVHINVNNKKERSVINLSSHVLTEIERAVLEKGLTFCPTPREPDMNQILEDLRLFFRRMRLKAYFHNPTENNGNISQSTLEEVLSSIPQNSQNKQCSDDDRTHNKFKDKSSFDLGK